MRILVLGATSGIGWSICKKLCLANDLLLVGRDVAGLKKLAIACRIAGAASVEIYPCDLSQGCKSVLEAANRQPIDLVINVASSTSQLRDSQIEMPALRDHVEVDLLAPVELVRELLSSRRDRSLRVLMVSSVLAAVHSPEREIYGRLKALQERCFQRLEEDSALMKLQIFRIGKVIQPGQVNPDTNGVADCVANVLATGQRQRMYGASGALMVFLFHLQPLLARAIVRLRRIAVQRTRPTLVAS
jgi:NAD(P)-dependent dehydrogenase (short-subunit alcohol dehydrogenase family)